MAKDKLKIVKEVIEKLLGLLEVKADVQIKEEDSNIQVQLESEEAGLLIGFHGQGLAGIQQIANLIVYHKTGEWPRIVVNVGDYWQRRKESLERMAKAAAQKVKFSKEKQVLPPMPPGERRIIHLSLADDTEVETLSEGEGRDRRVVIKPRGMDKE
jgi:spoIIIJ-associated protein